VDEFAAPARVLLERDVRFVVIGVWGANFYARSGATVFTTEDYDVFLPPDADTALKAWQACRTLGFELTSGGEPLGSPLDMWLAHKVVEQKALVRAIDSQGMQIDLTLVMAGFEFETVWSERRVFLVEGTEIPVARLAHIVASKAAAGREKDRLFLATHQEALRELMKDDQAKT
jgi:hypothetical protein